MTKTGLLLLLSLSAASALPAQTYPGAKLLPEGSPPLSPLTCILDPSREAEAGRKAAGALLLAADPALAGAEPAALLEALLRRPAAAPEGALVGTEAGSVFWFPKSGGGFTQLFSLHAAIRQLALSADRQSVAALTADGRAFLWRSKRPAELLELRAAFVERPGAETGPFLGIRLDAGGARALVQLAEGSRDEAAPGSYLVDLATGRATRVPGLSTSFTPDGQKLLRLSLDPHLVDESGAPWLDLEFASFEGGRLALFALPDPGPAAAGGLEGLIAARKPPVRTRFGLVWSEFGLAILSPRDDAASSQKAFASFELLPGGRRGLDLEARRDADVRQKAAVAAGLGIAYDEGRGEAIVSRPGSGGPLWTRVWATADPALLQYGLLLDRSQDLLALIVEKSQAGKDGGSARSGAFLAVLSWRSGTPILPEFPVGEARLRHVLAAGPRLDYLLLSELESADPLRSALYWPKSGILRSLDGTRTWAGPVLARFERGLGGSLDLGISGRRFRLGPAEGQVGSLVRFAVDPERRLLAGVDEAGRLFIRALATGKTLYSATLAELPEGSVGIRGPRPEAGLLSRAPRLEGAPQWKDPAPAGFLEILPAQGLDEGGGAGF